MLDGAYANDFEFAEELRKDGNPNEIETSFTRTASFSDKALGFLKQYWIWLVIAVCVLAFLVLGIVVAAKKPKRANVKAYEEELSEEAAEIAEEEEAEEEETEELPVTAQEAKESGNNGNNGNNGGNGAPNPYGNMPYGYPPAPYGAAPNVAQPMGSQPMMGAQPQQPMGMPNMAQPGMESNPYMQQPAGASLASMGAMPASAGMNPAMNAMGSPLSSNISEGAGSLGIGGLPLGMDSALNERGNSLGALPLGMDGALNDNSLGGLGALKLRGGVGSGDEQKLFGLGIAGRKRTCEQAWRRAG